MPLILSASPVSIHAVLQTGFHMGRQNNVFSPELETSSLMQDFNNAVFLALVYILTTFRATFSAFCIAETFTAAEALKFKQCIIAQ